MTLWITALAMVSTLTVTGLAFAQQATPQNPAQSGLQERGTGVSMTNPVTPDGQEIKGSTSFGQR